MWTTRARPALPSSGDADFDADFGVTSRDTTVLEFDVQLSQAGPTAALYLNFVFASEEYSESVNTGFSDAVAIFVDGENMALVPASTDRVSVDTVHGGHATNRGYFNDNPPRSSSEAGQQFGYDGYTDMFVARKEGLDTSTTHRVKIVIGDVGDQTGDSAVFIEAGSLADTPFVRQPQGITAILHQGQDDQNLFREQGQVLIHSNTISNSKTFAIVADAGQRGTDGTQSLSPDARRPVISTAPLQLAGNYQLLDAGARAAAESESRSRAESGRAEQHSGQRVALLRASSSSTTRSRAMGSAASTSAATRGSTN